MKRQLLSMIVAGTFFFCDPPTEDVIDCSTLSDPANGIELVYPKGMESFSYDELVDVKFKVDPDKISLVNLRISTTSTGPFRDIFSRSIKVPAGGGIQCIDTVWAIGKEHDPIDYASSSTFYLRVEKYSDATHSSTSGLITINKP